MIENLCKESGVIALALALGLGGTACRGEIDSREPVKSKYGAAIIEEKSAVIKYLGKNLRHVVISPGNTVFEESCEGPDMLVRRFDGVSVTPVSEVTVKDSRECKDNRITPKDFKEVFTLTGDYPH